MHLFNVYIKFSIFARRCICLHPGGISKETVTNVHDGAHYIIRKFTKYCARRYTFAAFRGSIT